MLETASVLSFYVAFALLHAADARRFPWRGVAPGRALLAAMRWGAVVALAAGLWLWTRTEGMAAALLVGLASFTVMATLFVLLAPLVPRALWGLAIACPPVIVALVLISGAP